MARRRKTGCVEKRNGPRERPGGKEGEPIEGKETVTKGRGPETETAEIEEGDRVGGSRRTQVRKVFGYSRRKKGREEGGYYRTTPS